MKKLFLLLLMSATFMCMAAQKKEVVIHPSEQTSTTGGRKYPRTPEPSIEAYIEEREGIACCSGFPVKKNRCCKGGVSYFCCRYRIQQKGLDTGEGQGTGQYMTGDRPLSDKEIDYFAHPSFINK